MDAGRGTWDMQDVGGDGEARWSRRRNGPSLLQNGSALIAKQPREGALVPRALPSEFHTKGF